jgi:hypothetical protein
VDGAAAGTATFSDSVTFPLGKTTVKIVGKLGTAFDSNDTISASTTPGTNFTTVTGQDSNETIVPTPSSVVTSNVMTVKAGALTISVAELTFQTRQIETYTAKAIEALTAGTLIYLALCVSIATVMARVERRFAIPGLIARGG